MRALAVVLFTTFTLTLAGAPALLAGDWPGFRGPDGAGVSDEAKLPAEWARDKNVAWKAKVPGYGWSSPVVWGDKVFVTTAVADGQKPPALKGPGGGDPPTDAVYRWEVHCLDAATGKPLWTRLAAEHKAATGNHVSNTHASETPVTDGERVYAYFGTVGVFCYDLAGKELWKRELGSYRMFGNWGTSASPALDGDRLFVQCDNEEKSFVVALDAKTGKELWRASRSERSTWSTPVVWRHALRTELVLMGPKRVRSYDVATGKVLWELATDEGGGRPAPPGGGGGKPAAGGCKSTPVATRDMIYLGMATKVAGQSLGPMWAVRPGASGDISLKAGAKSGEFVAWYRSDAGPHFASAAVLDGLLYVPAPHGGTLNCFDARTGADVYQKKLTGAGDFKASPWVHDGKLFLTDERGVTFVVKGGKEFELVRRNDIGDACWASPAPARGAVFLRGSDQLYCIRP